MKYLLTDLVEKDHSQGKFDDLVAVMYVVNVCVSSLLYQLYIYKYQKTVRTFNIGISSLCLTRLPVHSFSGPEILLLLVLRGISLNRLGL